MRFNPFNRRSSQALVFIFAVIGGMVSPNSLATSDRIRISYGGHPLDSYAVGLIELALAQLEIPIEVDVENREATQGRLKIDVMEGRYDIMWAATTKIDETDMQAIRFPLFKGLLGYRVLIIHADDQKRFSEVKELADLQQFSMGQALDWADTSILKSNGIKVITSSNYPSLFDMLVARRFDAFPRGVMEPWGELAARDLPQLKVEDELLLVYPMPFYFYVKKDNVGLAHLIGLGLEKALENGSFDAYFYSRLTDEFKLDLEALNSRRAIYLSNPNITPGTPIDRSELWLYQDLRGETPAAINIEALEGG